MRGSRGGTIAIAIGIALVAAPSAPARNAYVTNFHSNSVSVIDTRTDAVVGGAIAVGAKPGAIAITPTGSHAYVANRDGDSVSVIDTATNAVVGPAISVGDSPLAIAITPDGSRAYVANTGADTVSVIDTSTNTVVGTAISVGDGPSGIAITPDGSRAYVVNGTANTVSVIDTTTNAVVGPAISVTASSGIAITPNGSRAYVTSEADAVNVIDTSSNSVVGAPIAVGNGPNSIAIAPSGQRAYTGNNLSDDVSVIDTSANTASPTTIAVGDLPEAVAVTPAGTRAYTANFNSGNVSTFDTATGTPGPSITVQNNPADIAIVPNQRPAAVFVPSTTTAEPGQEVGFDAGLSGDSDGTIARYDWDFGDGVLAPNAGPTPAHAFTAPGTYTVRLTVTDNEGCSTALVFTGQTAHCNGGTRATTTREVTVTEPGSPPPADPSPVPPPPADRTAPKLVLEFAPVQRLRRKPQLSARCDERCSVRTKAKLKTLTRRNGQRRRASYTTRARALKPLAPNQPALIELKLTKKAREQAGKALRSGGSARVRGTVAAADDAANEIRRRFEIKLR